MKLARTKMTKNHKEIICFKSIPHCHVYCNLSHVYHIYTKSLYCDNGSIKKFLHQEFPSLTSKVIASLACWMLSSTSSTSFSVPTKGVIIKIRFLFWLVHLKNRNFYPIYPINSSFSFLFFVLLSCPFSQT